MAISEGIWAAVGIIVLACIVGIPLGLWYIKKKTKAIDNNIPKEEMLKSIQLEKLNMEDVYNARRKRVEAAGIKSNGHSKTGVYSATTSEAKTDTSNGISKTQTDTSGDSSVGEQNPEINKPGTSGEDGFVQQDGVPIPEAIDNGESNKDVELHNPNDSKDQPTALRFE